MNESMRHEEINPYLWDRSAPVDAAVAGLEDVLLPLKYDTRRRPLELPRGRTARWPIVTALAASLIVAAGVWFFYWRLEWPAGRAWNVQLAEAGAGSRSTSLAVGQTLSVPGGSTATIDIARLGAMRIAAGTDLTLRATSSRRHELQMQSGSIHVRVWAPPGRVRLLTPAGEVIDLGCEFDLAADAGRTVVRVRSGWVQLANSLDESLVPKGAIAEMRTGAAPGVAVFEDAAPEFIAAVRGLEAGAGDRDALLSEIVSTARVRDVYTLLMLVERREFGSDRLAARAADLSPPPAGVTVSAVVRGDRDALGRWRTTLPLPPPKDWLQNWRDGLPNWLVDRR